MISPHPLAGVPSDNVLFHCYFDKLISGAVERCNIFQYFWQYTLLAVSLLPLLCQCDFWDWHWGLALMLGLKDGGLCWGYHPERFQVQSRSSAQVKKCPHLFYGSPRRCDALWETAGKMHQPPAFILKGTANTTTNQKTKTRKNNLFHSLLAHARTVSFSLPSSQTQHPQRLLQPAALSSDAPQECTQPATPQAFATASCPASRSHAHGDSSSHPAHPEHPGPFCRHRQLIATPAW